MMEYKLYYYELDKTMNQRERYPFIIVEGYSVYDAIVDFHNTEMSHNVNIHAVVPNIDNWETV